MVFKLKRIEKGGHAAVTAETEKRGGHFYSLRRDESYSDRTESKSTAAR